MDTKKHVSSDLQQSYSWIITEIQDYLAEAKKYRATWEVRSYVDESFYQWNHRVVFDSKTNRLITLPLKSDQEYHIWKVRKIVRGVRNMITKNDPRWHPNSSRTQRVTDEEKRVASAILQNVYKEDHLKSKIKDLITHGLTKTLSWAFIWYDNEKKDVDIFIEDPFNIYTSPDGRLEWPVFVWKYIIRAIRKSLSDIKNSSLYKNWKFSDDLSKIEASSKMAESDMKHDLLSKDYQIPVDDNGSAIVIELYVMDSASENKKDSISDSISPEEDQMNLDSEKRVRIITMVWNVIIRDELTEYNQFPFIAYQPERDKGLLYSPSWINPLIHLNKALNDGYSNRADWLDIFAKWRYVVQKWTKFSVVKWRNGQIIEYTGSRPVKEDTWHLPNEVNIHLSDTERFMEDIGGIHSESTWRLSNSELSGVAIAQLQAADNNNVSEPVDNLKEFMQEMAYRILWIGSNFYWMREIDTEEWKEIVIGANVKKEISERVWEFKDDIVEIKAIRSIEVEIIPWSAFSDLQSRQDLVELRSLWVAIPDRLIIDAYKLWNTEMIMREYEDEQKRKQEMEDSIEWMEAKQAELENKKILEWANIVAQAPENHEIHLAVHASLLQQIKWTPQEQLLVQHMLQHEAMFAPENQTNWMSPNDKKKISPNQQQWMI